MSVQTKPAYQCYSQRDSMEYYYRLPLGGNPQIIMNPHNNNTLPTWVWAIIIIVVIIIPLFSAIFDPLP